MKCKKCGHDIQEGATFCIQCGEKIMEAETEKQSVVDMQQPKERNTTVWQKYDVFIVLAIVLVVSAILLFPLLKNFNKGFIYTLDGYGIPIANGYTYNDSEEGSLAILNDTEDAALYIQVLSGSTFSTFYQTMSQDSDLVLSLVSEMYSDYEVTDIAYPEIANVQTLRLCIRTVDGQQGYITYYPADDDQLIMAVYVQEDGTLNDQKFEHMMETIIDVDKSK